MRTVTVVMQTTLDNRIADATGAFWEPFTYGPQEEMYVNRVYREADTWVMGRNTYDAVAPWWDAVARGETPEDAGKLTDAETAFAAEWSRLRKVVISSTLASTDDRPVISGDIAAAVNELKKTDGGPIALSCGPATLAPLAAEPGLIDEYLLVVHPAVLSTGPRLFGEITTDLALRLVEGKVFASGAVVLRYAVR